MPARAGNLLPVNVFLKVPIVQAVEWDPWLTDNLTAAADKAGIECDGGEEEGRHEVFFFADAKPEEVETWPPASSRRPATRPQ